jgi:hypothetical protein
MKYKLGGIDEAGRKNGKTIGDTHREGEILRYTRRERK